MVFAETVQLDGGEVILLLLLLFGLPTVGFTLAVLGCVWCLRAGLGHPRALRKAAAVIGIEVATVIACVHYGGEEISSLAAVVLLVQVLCLVLGGGEALWRTAHPVPEGDDA